VVVVLVLVLAVWELAGSQTDRQTETAFRAIKWRESEVGRLGGAASGGPGQASLPFLQVMRRSRNSCRNRDMSCDTHMYYISTKETLHIIPVYTGTVSLDG